MDTCFRLVYGMAVQLLGGNGIHCRCAVPYHNQPGGFVPARVPAGSAYYGSLVMALPAYLMTVILLTGWNPGQIYNYAIFILSFWMTPLFLVVPVQIQQLGLSGLLLRAFDQCAHTLYMGLAVQQHNKSAGSLQTQIWCYQRLCLISLPAVLKETDSYINKTYPFSRGLLICCNCRFLILFCAVF